MSEHLQAAAEVAKLARLLNVSPQDLSYLDGLPSAALRAFRDSTTDMLFARDSEQLGRVAASSKMVPIAVAAKGAELAFGPLMCAALSGIIEPDRGVAVATRLPIPFLAEAAIDMDPRRATGVISAMPPQTVADVGRVLLGRGEFVTMGRFVGVLPDASLRAAAPVMSDADLLRIAFVLEDKSGLDKLMEITSERLPGIIRAAHDDDLWTEALDLLDNLSPDSVGRVGDIAAAHDDEVLDSLVRAALRLEAFDALLPVTRLMQPQSLDRFAEVPAVHEDAVLREILRVALTQGLWRDLLPLAAKLPTEARATVAREVANEDDAHLTALIRSAHEAGMWDSLIPIALAMSEPERQRMAALPLFAESAVLAAIIASAAEHDLWAAVLPLVDALPPKTRDSVAELIAALPEDQRPPV